MLSLEELKASQPEAVTHIQQVFASGRLHHAYVMAGPDESASAALAMAMATQILCKESQDPENCICRKKLAGSNHPDFLSIGPDEKGKIRIDDGALAALESGRSLLPAGVISVTGQFDRGDLIEVENNAGIVIGHGLSSYGSDDAVLICGHKSNEIETVLGYRGRDEMIHADNLVISDT